ncbi:CocE/NonD family hydrolase [Novosphingobium nitrogenifigens]|nr:CocE/NonD family hydrolase [Novosphingobium nitrogenifigens]
MIHASRLLAAALLLAGSSTIAVQAQTVPVTPMTPDVVEKYDPVLPEADFIRREVMVPMRDGTRLYTVIVMKKGTKGGPMLLSRSPYDAHGDATRTKSLHLVDIVPAMDAPFVEAGYIRVYQDIRGLHRSEGQFVMNRPLSGPLNPTGIDEATDAYDTIDWLVKNVPESNGKVGIIGSSYLGFTSLMAEIAPHPALKAAVPESPMVDGWMGDDWFHNGAFRVSALDYALGQSTGKADAGAAIPHGAGDDYTRYLRAGSAGDYARKYGVETVPFVRKLMENPAYTDFWSLQAVDKWLAARPLTVPTMLEVGQWDQEDSYGAPAVYNALKDKLGHAPLTLVIGPWRHSGANHYGYDLGALTFAGDTAAQWRRDWVKPFFDHWLRDAPDPKLPAAITYATGIDKWEQSPRWPMGSGQPYYLGPDHGAGFAAPDKAGEVSWVADPASPVPFLPRPIDMGDGAQWKSWLVRDQRFVSGRPDVVSFTGSTLAKPVHIMGAPAVDLFLATSGTDADVVVKLIDVYPDDVPEAAVQGAKPSMAGYELPIGIEIFRGRYLKSFAHPEPLTPGKFNRFRFTLPNVDHVFLPGHRIAVEVQSSLFPLYDRNPQTFVPNIFNAKPGDYKPATMRVGYGGATPSAVILPVVP